MTELSEKLELKKEQVEQKVGESKSDEISAMYNMMLDTKRREQGLSSVCVCWGEGGRRRGEEGRGRRSGRASRTKCRPCAT